PRRASSAARGSCSPSSDGGCRSPFQHARKTLRERMRVTRPACGDVVAVLNDESMSFVIEPVAVTTTGLVANGRIVRSNVLDIAGCLEGAGDLCLHRHVARGLARFLRVGAVVVTVPKARDARDAP